MPSRTRISVIADPGFPSQSVSAALASDGREVVEEPYLLSHIPREIPLSSDGTLALDRIRQWSRDDHADALIVVTEIPRRVGRRPTIVELQLDERLAIISLPALGPLRIKQRLRRALLYCAEALSQQRLPSREAPLAISVRQPGADDPSAIVSSHRWSPGSIRLVLGMVRTNRPFAAARKLSAVLAAATATAAFGVFYSSVWQMANALPMWRLGLISVSAVLIMVGWLIVNNRLWERSRHQGSLTEAAMYNASTVATLLLAVGALYLALFLGIFVVALVVIEADYLSEQLNNAASVINYIDIAWFSASLGTVAGALGSNFDSADDIRRLTHGQRKQHRFPADDETDISG